MKRWFFALAMAAMLGIGFAAGSILTHARAEDGQGVEYFRVVPLQRIGKTDPVAIRYNTQHSLTALIGFDGSIKTLDE